MAQPTYYAEGTTARSRDSKLRVWTKALGVKQNLLGASAKAANNPKPSDTIRRIKLKLLHAFRGTAFPGDFGSGLVGGGGAEEGFVNPDDGTLFVDPETGGTFTNPEA